uniref:(northern house mosquito) hypothetical protein n=1 Tax=Culex pipiens TaxID=7175 RepID=A0A8D8LDR6_CULPI
MSWSADPLLERLRRSPFRDHQPVLPSKCPRSWVFRANRVLFEGGHHARTPQGCLPPSGRRDRLLQPALRTLQGEISQVCAVHRAAASADLAGVYRRSSDSPNHHCWLSEAWYRTLPGGTVSAAVLPDPRGTLHGRWRTGPAPDVRAVRG